MPVSFKGFNDINDLNGEDDEIWDLLNIYADGEASEEEAIRAEALLRSNPDYAKQLNFISVSGSVLQSFVEVDPPSSLRSAIISSTTQRESLVSRMVAAFQRVRTMAAPRTVYATSIAGLAVAGLLLTVVFHHNGNSVDAYTKGPTTANTEVKTPHTSPPVETANPQVAVNNTATHTELTNTDHTSHVKIIVHPVLAANNTEVATKGKTNSNSKVVAYHPVKANNATDDSQPSVIASTFRPDMDAQNQRPTSTIPAVDDDDIPGPTVHTAELADTAAAPESKDKIGDGTAPAVDPTAPRRIVAHLTVMPPDPNQVLTHGDMARNQAKLTSGYDRSTLKSLERKEASVSFFKSTF